MSSAEWPQKPSGEPANTSVCVAPSPALLTSASPGQTPTKFCHTCARHLPLDQFTRLTSSPDGLRSRCKMCWQEVNDRCNGVSSIAYALVGGSKKFYSLPRETRLAVRKHAMRLYDAGADFVTAVQRTDVADGFVYIITHPAWPDYLKIGCAINPEYFIIIFVFHAIIL